MCYLPLLGWIKTLLDVLFVRTNRSAVHNIGLYHGIPRRLNAVNFVKRWSVLWDTLYLSNRALWVQVWAFTKPVIEPIYSSQWMMHYVMTKLFWSKNLSEGVRLSWRYLKMSS